MHRNWIEIAARIEHEQKLSVAQAARLVPADNRRGHCSAAALVGWILKGKRGVYLDGTKGAGKTWWTSREALLRFQAALSQAAANGRASAAPTLMTPGQATRRAREVVAKLRTLRRVG